MKRTLVTLFSVMLVAAAVVASVTDASAQRRWRGGGGGAGVAAGIIGGLAAGAIIGGALSSRPAYAYPAYRPVTGYLPYEGYYAAGPVACPGGYWARRPIAYDAYGRPIQWSRPRFFCP